MKEVGFDLTGMDCNFWSCFWTDFNVLDWPGGYLLLDWLEWIGMWEVGSCMDWIGMEEVVFGLTVMDWNGVSWSVGVKDSIGSATASCQPSEPTHQQTRRSQLFIKRDNQCDASFLSFFQVLLLPTLLSFPFMHSNEHSLWNMYYTKTAENVAH